MANRVFSPIPPGWERCPEIGMIAPDYPLIPMKVPLGPNFRVPHMLQLTQGHWTPMMALTRAHELVTSYNPDAVVGMVLDLTNSDKYYDPMEFTANNVRYCKIPCRGRGESPDPLAVNMAVWEIRKALVSQPNVYILVHCTHGFNRSGFVIVSAAMRLLADKGFAVARGLKRFIAQRPPGIYKDQYIADLFRQHNEHRPKVPYTMTPALPSWKPDDDPDEGGGPDQPYGNLPPPPSKQQQGGLSARMCHSDKVGDPVCMEEARWVLNVLYDALAGQDAWMRGAHIEGFPHYSVQNKPPGQSVIGSQPVSLDRENLELLRRKRYWVTWKADGTRYVMLLLKWGTYLIDRAGEVRRVHMRFPTRIPTAERKQGQYPLGPPHDFTILDGEMVVDDTDLEGTQQRRRFLIYDAMMLGGEGICDLRFADRYGLIQKEVYHPRQEEKNVIASMLKKQPPHDRSFLYDWELEAFAIRPKEFWPLDKARSVLDKMIPQLCHESDGLILQPFDDPYIPKTYPHLLKWKFPHMNSVDFKLDAKPNHHPVLQLNCGTRRKHGTSEVNHLSLGACGLGEQRVEFPPDISPLQYDAKIIECSFDMERKVWVFMRERTDKDTANHRSVFDKVMTSITDNITSEELLGVFDDAMRLDIYREEQMWRDGTHPSMQAQARRLQQQRAPQALPQHQQQLQHDEHVDGVDQQDGQHDLMDVHEDAAAAAADGDYDQDGDQPLEEAGMYSEGGADGDMGDGEGFDDAAGMEDDGDYNVTEQGL